MSVFTADDAKWMARAMQLAEQGRFSTTPNPNVGCVIVSNTGQLLGQGYHQKAGLAHAEVNALKDASTASLQNSSGKTNASLVTKGATVYLTLEPCSHQGKTPPCVNALIEAQVARVVIASVDHNPLVKSNGIKALVDAGVVVDVGLMADSAQKLNTAFNFRMDNKAPYLIVKLALSLDGKTALTNGLSKWITASHARANVQMERALSCAILSGADTILHDNPKLNVRIDELSKDDAAKFSRRGSQPLRVIIDGKNRLTKDYKVFLDGYPVLVFNAEFNPHLVAQHIEQVQVPVQSSSKMKESELVKQEYLDLNLVMQILAEKQINRVWTETGASLSGALFEANLVNELVIYYAPKILGNTARGAINIDSLTNMEQVKSLNVEETTQIGKDLKVRIRIKS